MPRTLPWLADAAKQKSQRSTGNSTTPARKRKADSSDEEDLVDDDLNIIRPETPERKPKKRTNRTPSTSPPPAPPDVEYMREGYNADDLYLMVEDEFLSTAKTYTQHIHHAEYVRLKKLARSRGAGTLDAINRPVDGRTKQSTALQMKLEAKEKDKKIKSGLKQAGDDGESSEVEDEYMHDPQLAGLMTRDRQDRNDLSNLTKAKSNTRAAAGFSQSPHNIERKKDALAIDNDMFSDDTDDLDNALPKRAKSSVRMPSTKVSVKDSSFVSAKSKPPKESPKIFKHFAKSLTRENANSFDSSRKASPPKRSPARESMFTKSQSTDTIESRRSHSAPDYLTKRRLERERKEREEKRKAKKPDDVPTFLI